MTDDEDDQERPDGALDATDEAGPGEGEAVAEPDETDLDAGDSQAGWLDDGDLDEEGTDEENTDEEGTDEGGDDDDEEGPSRVMLLVGAAVAFVAIAIVGILIASSGGNSDDGSGGDGGGATAGDARTDVGIYGTIDQFDQADSATSLGNFAPGRPWTADAGTWGIDRNEAYVAESSEFRNHAVVGAGQGDGGVQVRLDKVTSGAGIVFRYVGPYNYWAIVAVPDVVTWNIVKVTNGDQEVVGNTGQSPVGDGTTIGVRLRGDTIEVIVNGRIRKTIVDDFQARAGKVGMTAKGEDAGDTRFDDFVVGLPGGLPLPEPGRDGGPGGSSTTTAAP